MTSTADDLIYAGEWLTIRAMKRGRIREVCVPATLPGLPNPTPTPAPCSTPTPTPTSTPPYGSASRAFVKFVSSLLE